MCSKPSAVLPDATERMACRRVEPPHPSVLDPERLLDACDLRTQRRSGPGGQHRNKTSSGAFLVHRPTEVIGEATERRSQIQNREVALQRLRFSLAVAVRTVSPLDPETFQPIAQEQQVRRRYAGTSLRLAESNADKPALLALVLNDLWIAGGQPSLLRPLWAVSTSKLVALLRSHAPALALVNRFREHHQRLPLH